MNIECKSLDQKCTKIVLYMCLSFTALYIFFIWYTTNVFFIGLFF